MGLVKNVILAGLILGGAFVAGRCSYKMDIKKEDVFDYIDYHEEDRKEIFLYGLEHLKRDDTGFLGSLTINSLNNKQKEEIAKDYLRSKFRETYEEGKKSLRDLPENLYKLLTDDN
ncbi:hypothetical protein ES703_83988 [subsurface metagenome]